MSVQHLQGDVFERLADLPDESFDCVVTSPPYWGLRDYGMPGQIGMEPTLGEHLDVMVRVFAEIHRVLKPTGTLWLNYGDCYATTPNGRSAADTKAASDDDRTFRDKPFSTVGPILAQGSPSNATRGDNGKNPKATAGNDKRVMAGGLLKPKDLCMVPNRLAIALQEWGWWVRSEIIWAKPNPMPESIKDRPATSHEKIWLLSKEARYRYDNEAVRVPAKHTGLKGMDETGFKNPGSFKGKHQDGYRSSPPKDKQRGHSRRHAGFNERWDKMSRAEQQSNGRNLRNYEPAPVQVWEVATRPFSGAHFATFPPELVERCLSAGCPKGGRVLDPFGGAGTTGLVADRMQMNATLIELNPDYVDISLNRIGEDRGGLLEAME